MGNLIQTFLHHFHSYFLPNLGRLNFGKLREKIARSYQFSLIFPLLTKHYSHPFSLSFYTIFFPSSLKSSQLNIHLGTTKPTSWSCWSLKLICEKCGIFFFFFYHAITFMYLKIYFHAK